MGAAASDCGDDAMENTVSPELMVCGLVISLMMSLRLIIYEIRGPKRMFT